MNTIISPDGLIEIGETPDGLITINGGVPNFADLELVMEEYTKKRAARLTKAQSFGSKTLKKKIENANINNSDPSAFKETKILTDEDRRERKGINWFPFL